MFSIGGLWHFRCWSQMLPRSEGDAATAIESDKILPVVSCLYDGTCPVPPPAVLVVLDEYPVTRLERCAGACDIPVSHHSFVVARHLTFPLPQRPSPELVHLKLLSH